MSSFSKQAKPIEASGQGPPKLRPFFGFYGGKWRDALKQYPAPLFDLVIEPFAGSAGYSLRYPNRKIVLWEIDPIIAQVWRYLISVQESEILSIPDLRPEESVDDLHISQEAKWLVGFWLNRGISRPRKTPSKWMRNGVRPGSFWGGRVRHTIASQLEYIRHWDVNEGSYSDCHIPKKATWFIDPPYQETGHHYRFGSDQIDYKSLADWCVSRPGQVIVCENSGANWLPFRALSDVKTTRVDRRSKEVYWLDAFGILASDGNSSLEMRNEHHQGTAYSLPAPA
jgi:hypothetical protein